VQARIDEAEMRTAVRLIQAALSVAVGHLKAIIRTGEWVEYLHLDLRHWDAEQRTLARRLNRDDWQAVSLAAVELPAMDAGWRLISESTRPAEVVRTGPIDPAGKPELEQMWDHATAAWNASRHSRAKNRRLVACSTTRPARRTETHASHPLGLHLRASKSPDGLSAASGRPTDGIRDRGDRGRRRPRSDGFERVHRAMSAATSIVAHSGA
jgi:hypothetical protein